MAGDALGLSVLLLTEGVSFSHIVTQGLHPVFFASSIMDEAKLLILSLKPVRFVPVFRKLLASALDSRTDAPLRPIDTLYSLCRGERDLDDASVELVQGVGLCSEFSRRRAGVLVHRGSERIKDAISYRGSLKLRDTLKEARHLCDLGLQAVFDALDSAQTVIYSRVVGSEEAQGFT